MIGSSGKLHFELQGESCVLRKTTELGSFDDREVKPENIGLHIGRRPILSFGNSDGDLAMLRYTKTGSGARLALLLHHDDGEREVAYDREFKLSPLVEALDKGGGLRHHRGQHEERLGRCLLSPTDRTLIVIAASTATTMAGRDGMR